MTTDEQILEAYRTLAVGDRPPSPAEKCLSEGQSAKKAAPAVTGTVESPSPVPPPRQSRLAPAPAAESAVDVTQVLPEQTALVTPRAERPASPPASSTARELDALSADQLLVAPTLPKPAAPRRVDHPRGSRGPGHPRRQRMSQRSTIRGPRSDRSAEKQAEQSAPAAPAPRRARRISQIPHAKRWFVSALVLGVLAYSGAGGSFSSFNAETNNTGSSIASGTLALSDQLNSQTACLSSGGSVGSPVGNVNTACNALFSLTNIEPGTWSSSTQTASITLKNTGSLNASSLFLWAPTSTDCTDTQTTSSPVSGALYGTQLNYNPTTGNPFCAAVLMYIQESTVIGGNTYYYCWVGYDSPGSPDASEASTGGLCGAPISSITLSAQVSGAGVTSLPVTALNGPVYSGNSIVVTSGSNTQTFTASANVAPGSTSIPVNSVTANATYAIGSTVADSSSQSALDSDQTDTIHNFDSTHAGSTGRLQLYPISGAGTVNTSATTALAALGTRTFTVGLYMPNPTSTSQNALQGLQSSFGIDWYMNQ